MFLKSNFIIITDKKYLKNINWQTDFDKAMFVQDTELKFLILMTENAVVFQTHLKKLILRQDNFLLLK